MQRLEHRETSYVQLIAGGTSFLSAVGAAIYQFDVAFELAWLVPPVFTLFFCVVLFVLYSSMTEIWICRFLAKRINHLVGERALIRMSGELPHDRFFSTRRGNVKYRLLLLMILGTCTTVYIVVAALLTTRIMGVDRVAGVWFLVLVVVMAGITLFVYSGLMADLPRVFRSYEIAFDAAGRFISMDEMGIPLGLGSGIKSILLTLLPRPYDVFTKGPMFAYGVLSALALVGAPQQRPLPLDALIQFPVLGDLITRSANDIGALILLIILYFCLEEILLQQSKLLWDDIRDYRRDKKLLLNKDRAVARGDITIQDAITHFIVRWSLALLGGYLIGGFPLIMLFGVISAHQAIYVLWAKPHAGEHPVLVLAFLALNSPLRVAAGILVVTGTGVFVSGELLIVLVSFYFNSFGTMAGLWRIEAVHYTQAVEAQAVNYRPQWPFFLRNGLLWQRVGFLSAILAGAFLCALYYVGLSTGVSYSWATLIVIALSICPVSLLALTIERSVVRAVGLGWGHSDSRQTNLVMAKATDANGKQGLISSGAWDRQARVGLPILLLVAYTAIGLSLGWSEPSLFVLAILLMHVGFLMNFEGITYRDFILADLSTQIRDALKRVSAFVFLLDEGGSDAEPTNTLR